MATQRDKRTDQEAGGVEIADNLVPGGSMPPRFDGDPFQSNRYAPSRIWWSVRVYHAAGSVRNSSVSFKDR